MNTSGERRVTMLVDQAKDGYGRSRILAPYGKGVTLCLVAYTLLLSFAWPSLPFRMQWGDFIFLGLLGSFIAAGGIHCIRLMASDYVMSSYVIGSLCSLLLADEQGDVGVQVAKLIYLPSVYLVIRTLCLDEHLRTWTVWGMAGGAALLSLVGAMYLLAYWMFDIPAAPLALQHAVPYWGETLRMELNFYTPELLGCFLTVGVAFALALRKASQPGVNARWWTMAGLLMLMTEAFTFSHSVVGFVCAAMIASYPKGEGPQWMWIRRGLLAATVLLFLGMLFVSTVYIHKLAVESRKVPASTEPVDSHVLQSDEWAHTSIHVTYSYLQYHVLKVLAWETFLDHPFRGVGLGNFPAVSERAYQEGRLSQNCRSCEPHNTVLGQLAETGLLGGLPLIALWTWLLLDGWRLLRSSQGTQSEWLARACFGGLVGLFVNGLYTDVMDFRFLWVNMAVLHGLALSARWADAPRAQEGSAQTARYVGSEAPTTV